MGYVIFTSRRLTTYLEVGRSYAKVDIGVNEPEPIVTVGVNDGGVGAMVPKLRRTSTAPACPVSKYEDMMRTMKRI